MTWARAVMTAMAITVLLFIFLGFIPSIFRYWWDSHSDLIATWMKSTIGIQFKDTYSMVRLHDAITMGVQTVFFAIPIAATYILGEKRRRRLGLRGNEGVKGYLPGK
jgi:hypothetical protein